MNTVTLERSYELLDVSMLIVRNCISALDHLGSLN